MRASLSCASMCTVCAECRTSRSFSELSERNFSVISSSLECTTARSRIIISRSCWSADTCAIAVSPRSARSCARSASVSAACTRERSSVPSDSTTSSFLRSYSSRSRSLSDRARRSRTSASACACTEDSRILSSACSLISASCFAISPSRSTKCFRSSSRSCRAASRSERISATSRWATYPVWICMPEGEAARPPGCGDSPPTPGYEASDPGGGGIGAVEMEVRSFESSMSRSESCSCRRASVADRDETSSRRWLSSAAVDALSDVSSAWRASLSTRSRWSCSCACELRETSSASRRLSPRSSSTSRSCCSRVLAKSWS
mmetsp:Transcript_12120/g.39846  ORF Transcript_12120/g.39846 Transcript_12120/m.39846 type:complete len:319 (-) Transcript_12120:116-1072(-)